MIKQVLKNLTAYDYTSAFFNSPCFQYILRKKRLTFWEISIGLNFISLTINDEKSVFWLGKWGVDLYTSSTYTRVNTVCATICQKLHTGMLQNFKYPTWIAPWLVTISTFGWSKIFWHTNKKKTCGTQVSACYVHYTDSCNVKLILLIYLEILQYCDVSC